MIPVKLSVQGLYSYQRMQEVDFRHLTNANVFGIFGKVGSGKTSLLEAISFALYGETERLNSRDNRLYNMMNLKSKHLLIDFEFIAGPEQERYRFVYEAKRSSKKHQDISAGEHRKFVWKNDDWSPVGNEKDDVSVLAKQIIGLDYDNFKRTIIIPQNQFREFLELGAADRTRMMNQLFGLDQYDLAGRVGKLTKVNDNQLAELRGLLAPLAEVDPNAIEQAETTIATLTGEQQQKTTAIGQLEPTESALLAQKKVHETLQTTQHDLDKWLLAGPVYEQKQQFIGQYEQCQSLFQARLSTLADLQTKRAGLVAERETNQNRRDVLTRQLPDIRLAYSVAKKTYDNRPQLRIQIDELDTINALITVQSSVGLQQRNIATVRRQVDEQQTRLTGYQTNRHRQQQWLDEQADYTLQLARLYEVRNWFTAYRPLQKQANDLQAQLDACELAIETIKSRRDTVLTGFDSDWQTAQLKELPAMIDQALAHLSDEEEQCQRVDQQAQVKLALRQYADALVEGSPCPLCGSLHHPDKHLATTDLTTEVGSSDALKRVRQQVKAMTSLRLTVGTLLQELRGEITTKKRLIDQRHIVIRERTAHEDLFVWSDFSIEQDGVVQTAIEQATGQQKKQQETRKAIQELDIEIERATGKLNQLTQQLGNLTAEVAGLEGQVESMAKSLRQYKPAEVLGWNLVHIADLKTELEAQFGQAERQFERADRARSDAEKEDAVLQERVGSLITQLADTDQAIDTEEAKLTEHLTEQNLTRPAVEQLLRQKPDLDAERQQIRAYHDGLADLRGQLNRLEEALLEQPFDASLLDTVQDQLLQLRTERDDLNQALGRAQSLLDTVQQQWKARQEYQRQHDEFDLRQKDLDTMEKLFKAQGFVNYVSSVYLKNLCLTANERFFKLTNNQLKLELDDKNNFQVRDFMNGGTVRSVKTLSGGQTFQASLSLALALSDNIQKLTQAKQNLFFLDEGFGTLDKESLQTVFQTLKSLRSEHRVVGIISHVEDLQHEVDQYIRTEATDEGSRIICSWAE